MAGGTGWNEWRGGQVLLPWGHKPRQWLKPGWGRFRTGRGGKPRSDRLILITKGNYPQRLHFCGGQVRENSR